MGLPTSAGFTPNSAINSMSAKMGKVYIYMLFHVARIFMDTFGGDKKSLTDFHRWCVQRQLWKQSDPMLVGK